MPQRGAPQFGASLPHDRRRERPVGPGQFHSERRIRAGRVVPPGRCGFAMVRRSGGATARPLESIWASLPHDRRRERPVGPGQFHSERRIRAGRVVPSGRCGFAMVRRSGGATARPLDSIWSLSAAWSPSGEARRTGPISFREANQSGPCGASRAVRICQGAPQRGRNCPATGVDLEPLCRMIGAGRGPSDRANFIQRGESERAVWCLTGRPDSPWCAAAGAQLPGHWSRFGPLCRMIAAGRGPSDRAVWCLPGGADLPWCAAAGAQLPGHWSRFGPLCRMIAAGRGPSDRAVWCLPGRADLPWCAAAGAQLPGHWIRFGASLPHGRRRERPVGPGHVVPPGGADLPWCAAAGAQLPGHWIRFGASLPHGRRRERPVGPGHVVPPGGADLPWCAAAGAQLPGHWIRFGASLPHDRRRERPVGPGQFHSERRIRAGRVVPPGRCGFAMVRRSGGATARPLDSIWSLSAAWSASGEARRTGPVSFREANQSGPCGASRAVRICHGAPQRGRNCPATGFDLEPLCRMVAVGGGPSDRASFIQRGESERAVWCLPGGADSPWCAAAGAQLPGHWIRFGASLPHGRRRERPVGPGQFHSERRIRAGRVVPPGRCGFAMVRRSGGATARPLDSIWSLSAARSPLLSTGPIAGQQQRLRTGIEPPR